MTPMMFTIWMKPSYFFRVLRKYTVLLPEEDITIARGKKNAKERVTLVVCANATGTHKIPLCMIRKPKNLPALEEENGL